MAESRCVIPACVRGGQSKSKVRARVFQGSGSSRGEMLILNTSHIPYTYL